MKRIAWLLAFGLLGPYACGDKKDGPSPTPTPVPSLTIQPVITISGTTAIERGECVSFRIQTTNFQVSPSAQVRFGTFELAPSFFLVLDTDTIEVGFPCFFTPLTLSLGPLDVAVIDGVRSVSAVGAFTVAETTRVDLGNAPADSSGAAEPDANTLQSLYDFDIYTWHTAPGLLLSRAIVSSSATPAFRPLQFVASTNGSLNFGGREAVLVPVASARTFTTEVADHYVGGGAGYGYHTTIEALAPPSPAVNAVDDCSAAAAFTSSGVWSIDLSTMSAGLNPAGAIGCVDPYQPQPPVAGEGVRATGKDAALRVTIPAGATFQAAARSDVTDVVLYLLPDNAGSCNPSACLTAADLFGIGDTDSVLWVNSSGTATSAWLIVDDFGSGSAPGPVTVWIR